MSRGPVVQIFFDEAEELLRVLENGVIGLEAAPDDREVLHSVFRAVHTLKGKSSMLGFERIATMTHALEELLARLRAGESSPGREVIDTLLAANDMLGVLFGRALAGDDREVPELGALVDRLADHARSAGHHPTAAAPGSAKPVLYEIRFEPPDDLLRRGLDPLRLIEALGALGELVRVETDAAAPSTAADLDPETSHLVFTAWLRTRAPRTAVEACLDFVDEPGAVHVSLVPTPSGVATPPAPAAAPGPAPERQRWAGDTDTHSIRVATDKVDQLVDLVGELVITQSRVAQLVHQIAHAGATTERMPALAAAVAQMDRHARDLEERVMAIRMLPIRTVFARFSRVVRDLAQGQGKRVLFETHGDDTALDKTVIERIGDPLMHLVRNAVDHGIEPPGARRARGKPERGRLTLTASQRGGSIHIEIQDDGRGLDRERIRAKALDLGLVRGHEALSDEQVYALIFQPGLSTAEQVTEVSGRGVGMDVVERSVEALGGSISIQSTPGRGTTFQIKLPLTLATLEGQSLRVGDQVYILPLATIAESVRPTREMLRTVFGAREAFIMRGEVLPFVRLHRLFAVARAEEDPTRGLGVVVEHEGRRVALLVDELLGQQQFVIKSLDASFRRVDGVAGATILGDGRVALILDVPGLITLGKAA